jgi:hypothetical protein
MAYGIVFVVMSITCQNSSINSTGEIAKQFLKEYPQSALVLDESTKSFQAKGAITVQTLSGKVYTTKNLEVYSSGDKQAFIRGFRTSEIAGMPPSGPVFDVFCRTPDYLFKLTKKSEGGQYLISYYQDSRASDDVEYIKLFDIYARSSISYMQETLLHRIQSPTFVIHAEERLTEYKGDAVRFNYSYEGNQSESGDLILCPSRSWAILGSNLTVKSKNIPLYYYKSKIDYSNDVSIRMIAKDSSYELTVPQAGNKEKTEKAHLILSAIKNDSVPDGVFGLPYYGLPDIPLRGVPNSSMFSVKNPLFWGSMILAIASFAILKFRRGNRQLQ